VRGLRVFFASVDRQLDAAPPPERDVAVRRALAAARVPTTLGAVEVLGDSTRRAMLAAATEATVRERFGQGIARGAGDRARLPAVRVRGLPDGERLVPSDSLRTADEFFSGAAAALPPELGADAASCSASCWCATSALRWRATRRRRAPPAPAHVPRWIP
jgi:hypothetical protein